MWRTSLASAAPTTNVAVMAPLLPRTAVSTSVSRHASHQLRNKASILGNLADAISTQWDKMEHQARLSIVRKMQVLALELGQLADRSGPSFGRADLEAGSPWFDGLSLLTPREHEVLRALTFGASTERIGELLGVTTSTVRSHVKSVLAKLGVHSRIEAVALLVRRDTHLDKPA